MIKGISVSPGVAIGRVFIMENEEQVVTEKKIKENKVNEEIKRFTEVLKKAGEEIEDLKGEITGKLTEEDLEIFDAHLMFLKDPEFIKQVENKISIDKFNARTAVDKVISNYVEIFSSMDNEYISARTADLEDVRKRIIRLLMNKEKVINRFKDKVIIFADNLIPSDTASLDKDKVLAILTRQGSKTSHFAIMARSLGIPAIVGLGNDVEFNINEEIIVDGNKGYIYKNPDTRLLAKYNNYILNNQKEEEQLSYYKNKKTVTKDGSKITLAGNIGDKGDVELIIKNGGEGIGLFRSEFLYMNSNEIPPEEEQFKAYKEVADKMAGFPVIIRTLDIGGDKNLPYLESNHEMNPFLGYRAVRMYFNRPEIYKSQLRAILRAGYGRDIKLMLPMISSLSEIRHAKQIINNIKVELNKEGLKYNKNIEIGIMIETPAAALMADVLAEEVDFFSLGTNDLIQYTLAADRTNEKVADFYTPYHPAVLSLLRMTVEAAHSKGIMVSMCGELAANEKFIPFLLGIGLDELSVNASSILKNRKIISDWTITRAKKVAEKTLKMRTCSEIKNYLTGISEY